jgi:DNA polymerase III epsilon subunit-like protein
VVEVAAVRLRGGVELDRWRQLVNPEGPIPAAVTALHGITDAAVRECPPARVALRSLRDFVQGSVLLAHHAVFDRDILAAEYVRAGLCPPEAPLYCTRLLAKAVLPSAGRYSLAALVEHLGLSQAPTHRALPDALAAAMLFRACLARREGTVRLGDLGRLAGVAGAPMKIAGAVRPVAALPLRLRPLEAALREGRAVEVTVDLDGARSTETAVPTSLYARGTEAWVDLRAEGTGGVRSVALGAVTRARSVVA